MNWFWLRHDRPREIPQQVYSHLVLDLGVDGDSLSRLKAVTRPNYLNGKEIQLIRLYDPEITPGLKVTDFTSLDGHPEPVIYEGWLDPSTRSFHFQPG